jgi:hypothetical protein
VLDKVKEMVHEGNVRRVVVKHGGRKVAEFPRKEQAPVAVGSVDEQC